MVIDRSKFNPDFCQDCSAARGRLLAAAEVPTNASAFAAPLIGTPAWRQFPAWYGISNSSPIPAGSPPSSSGRLAGLVAANRPFVALPLASHFEQRLHVRHRLDRYGARTWLEYADASPGTLADAIATASTSTPSYQAIDSHGDTRAAAVIAELL